MLSGIYYFVYRDIEGKRDQMARLANGAEELSLRNGILLGGHGGATLYVRRILHSLREGTMLVVGVTDYVTTEGQRDAIISRAMAMMGSQDAAQNRLE